MRRVVPVLTLLLLCVAAPVRAAESAGDEDLAGARAFHGTHPPSGRLGLPGGSATVAPVEHRLFFRGQLHPFASFTRRTQYTVGTASRRGIVSTWCDPLTRKQSLERALGRAKA